MELAGEEEDGVVDFDAYTPDAEDQARAFMAPLGSLCTDAVGLRARTQVDGGNKKDGLSLWHGLKKCFTHRQQLTTVGLLEKIMSRPVDETSVRAVLPTGESAFQKFEARAFRRSEDRFLP